MPRVSRPLQKTEAHRRRTQGATAPPGREAPVPGSNGRPLRVTGERGSHLPRQAVVSRARHGEVSSYGGREDVPRVAPAEAPRALPPATSSPAKDRGSPSSHARCNCASRSRGTSPGTGWSPRRSSIVRYRSCSPSPRSAPPPADPPGAGAPRARPARPAAGRGRTSAG